MHWPSHGGQPSKINEKWGLPADHKLLDFSANLNPLGPPEWLAEEIHKQMSMLAVYPDPDYEQARGAIAHDEQIDPSQVLLTNGGAEAIFLAAVCPPRTSSIRKKALIVQPTFVEYERACQQAQLQVEHVYLDVQDRFGFPITEILHKIDYYDLLFLCRPNNPTGTIVEKESIQQLLEKGLRTGTTVVIDEAFIDFASAHKLTSYIQHYPNLLLLRSLTKMYTIPGLRLGYVLAQKETIQRLKEQQIPWSVNALSAGLVESLLADKHFLQDTQDWLHSETERIVPELERLHYSVSPTQANFYVLQDQQQVQQTEAWFHYLLQKGILARHTVNFMGLDGRFLRFALRSKEENDYLLHVLAEGRRGR